MWWCVNGCRDGCGGVIGNDDIGGDGDSGVMTTKMRMMIIMMKVMGVIERSCL